MNTTFCVVMSIILIVETMILGESASNQCEDEVRMQLTSASPAEYRNKAKENLLHLAIRSGNIKLIRQIDSLYPRLKDSFNAQGEAPLEFAVAHSTLLLIKNLDSLGFDFYHNTYEYFYLDWPVGIPVFKQARNRLLCSLASQGDTMREAEAVYTFVLRKLTEKKWVDVRKWSVGSLQDARTWYHKGCSNALDAVINLFNKNPTAIEELFQIRSLENYDSTALSIITRCDLPVNKTWFFFKALDGKHQPLIRAFIEQGALVNDHSVYNGRVYSALTFANEINDPSTVVLLKASGASDSLWYELLVPGYWPTITNFYSPGRQWYTVRASGDSVNISSGELDPNDFSVQRREYWNSNRKRTLFMVATNKPEGIKNFTTSVAGPRQLGIRDTLRIRMPSGSVYELSLSSTNETAVIVKQDNRSQSFFNTYYFSWTHGPGVKGVCVLWAGDIDNDKRLDIILTESPIEADEEPNTYYLFLSSLATGNLLLGKADESNVLNSYDGYSAARRGNYYKVSFYPKFKTVEK